MTPYFFGYGSLVNRQTHNYPHAEPAQLTGWQRVWVRAKHSDTVFLSVEPARDIMISGLIAQVPNADWRALDQRESGYERQLSGNHVSHDLDHSPEVAHYVVPSSNTRPDGAHRILLSYLDVVVQGFLREFDAQGVDDFFKTTRGWDTPILDDRDAPLYPRHQNLSGAERKLVDDMLAGVNARVNAQE